MRRPALAALLLPLLLPLAAACGDATGPGSSFALQRAQARWQHAAPADYDVTVALSCYCLDQVTRPVVVRVRDGVVESRRYADDGLPVPAELAGRIPDVPGLFAVVADALARDAASLDVAYDPRHGHPVRIAIDYHAQMVDDEVAYSASPLRQP